MQRHELQTKAHVLRLFYNDFRHEIGMICDLSSDPLSSFSDSRLSLQVRRPGTRPERVESSDSLNPRDRPWWHNGAGFIRMGVPVKREFLTASRMLLKHRLYLCPSDSATRLGIFINNIKRDDDLFRKRVLDCKAEPQPRVLHNVCLGCPRSFTSFPSFIVTTLDCVTCGCR
jgi:hypothetical protein